jgi:hypothetical protein
MHQSMRNHCRRFALGAAMAVALAAPLAASVSAHEFEPGDDRGGRVVTTPVFIVPGVATFPVVGVAVGDDHGIHFEPGDDHGMHLEPGDDHGGHSGPG